MSEQDFGEIQVELSNETKFSLIKMFVRERLCPAAQNCFNTQPEGTFLEDALFNAVINEMVMEGLVRYIDDHKVVRENTLDK